MAIGIFKSLEFGGINSADYGVYITGEAVYNAPERAVEQVDIPGRNGAFLMDLGRFENIEVTYPCGIPGDDQTDFAEKISEFRNAILSKRGYQRLTDEYNPSEYRMASYVSGMEVEAVEGQQGTVGEFELTFNCKPQRWLVNGETAVTVADGDTLTNPTRFDSEPLLEVEGYGTIGFNGYEIELEDGSVGTIQLASQTFSGEKTFTFDQSLLNNGDTITLSGTAVYTSTSDVTSATNTNSAYSSTISGRIVTTSFSLTLSKGTDFTSSNTLTIVRAGSPVDFTSQILYTSSGDTGTLSFSTSLLVETSWTWSFDAVGDSTFWRLGNPTYIDCELGECYMYKDGSIVSLNTFIDLGSDLPKLAPGINTFDTDSTITELKVIPRWWKV